ncbi:MBL fold metallo-hydrolase [Nocardia nova]|uniref:MBL fold metallo-hydrolase n=1 Tax=Nocardia nova TaxID=37330 RepID=UPI0033C21921
MELTTTYIGQQSWMLTAGTTRVLVDPVLTESFGNSDELRFEIWPPRRVEAAELPRIDAVVITNEHLDHFHVPSLRMLPADTVVIVPSVLPQVCIDTIEAVGLRPVLLAHGEPYAIADTVVRLFQGSPEAPSWESRVTSLYFGPQDSGSGIFVQSDTEVELDDAVRQCDPVVYISTHNAQICPPGHLGAFENMLPFESETGHNTVGVDILQSVLNQPMTLFPQVKFILLSGTGYLQRPRKHGKFLWSDLAQLEMVANRLSIDTKMVGLTPGRSAVFSGETWTTEDTGWIAPLPDTEAEPDLDGASDIDLNAELPALFGDTATPSDRDLITRELDAMAPLLMLSPLGKALINTNTYLGERVGSVRFAVCLRGFVDDEAQVFGLDFNRARFVPVEGDVRTALMAIPSGIDCHTSDLAAVLRGRIHIWELATSRLRQWYLTSRMDSPVAFLYTLYSEQVRPDLAETMYRNALAEPVL